MRGRRATGGSSRASPRSRSFRSFSHVAGGAEPPGARGLSTVLSTVTDWNVHETGVIKSTSGLRHSCALRATACMSSELCHESEHVKHGLDERWLAMADACVGATAPARESSWARSVRVRPLAAVESAVVPFHRDGACAKEREMVRKAGEWRWVSVMKKKECLKAAVGFGAYFVACRAASEATP